VFDEGLNVGCYRTGGRRWCRSRSCGFFYEYLQSPHFLEYKASTLPMVKSLRLVEMSALDVSAMPALLRKLP
jgi:hypothetical protein